MFKGDFCFVEDINLVHVILRTWDGRRSIVPNSLLQSEVIVNYSIRDPTMLVPVLVQVSYDSDLKKAMDIMVDIAKKHPDCLPTDDTPNVAVMEFQHSGVLLRLLRGLRINLRHGEWRAIYYTRLKSSSIKTAYEYRTQQGAWLWRENSTRSYRRSPKT